MFTLAINKMKCSQFYRILIQDGWYPVCQSGSHIKMKHPEKRGTIIFPNHGSDEIGYGLYKKIKRDAGIK
ncbi:MAG TPA: addiction module toxin, HicA family [Rikenellaceae bacterium]|nr:addiction module toxin, HicA family [Rikenellaceae bacterium]